MEGAHRQQGAAAQKRSQRQFGEASWRADVRPTNEATETGLAFQKSEFVYAAATNEASGGLGKTMSDAPRVPADERTHQNPAGAIENGVLPGWDDERSHRDQEVAGRGEIPASGVQHPPDRAGDGGLQGDRG